MSQYDPPVPFDVQSLTAASLLLFVMIAVQDGWLVGLPLGLRVGFLLTGLRDGLLDGARGLRDGLRDGFLLRTLTGFFDGLLDGLRDGFLLTGLRDGLAVGARCEYAKEKKQRKRAREIQFMAAFLFPRDFSATIIVPLESMKRERTATLTIFIMTVFDTRIQ
jgi:hypothetical protein